MRVTRKRNWWIFSALVIVAFFVASSIILLPVKSAVDISHHFLNKRVIRAISQNRLQELFFSAASDFRQEKFKKVVERCEVLIRDYSEQLPLEDRRSVYAMLGLAYDKLNRADKQFPLYEQLMQTDPPYAHFLRAIALDDAGNPQQAKEEFQLALNTSATSLEPLDENSLGIIRKTLSIYDERSSQIVEK